MEEIKMAFVAMTLYGAIMGGLMYLVFGEEAESVLKIIRRWPGMVAYLVIIFAASLTTGAIIRVMYPHLF